MLGRMRSNDTTKPPTPTGSAPPAGNPRWLRASTSAFALCAAYILLDWASYIDPLHHFNITPWNPAPALGILYLLRRAAGGPLTLWAAILATDLIFRETAANAWQFAVLDALLTAGYVAMASLMQRLMPENGMFANRTSLGQWTAIVVIGSLANSLVFVTGLVGLELIPGGAWQDAVLRFWIGDGVGIFVTFPFLWWLQDRPRRDVFRLALLRLETAGYLGLVLAILWLIFSPAGINDLRYLYALFLPVVWAASRQGITGAIFCASVLQLGMLSVGWLWEIEAVSIFELQMRALLLAGVGFVIGTAVDEQRRTVNELRHSLRLAAAGEMAGALAHELNQPLTALAAYGAASKLIIARDGGSEQLRDVIERMVAEAARASEVVRRLRDFFRTGSTRLEKVMLSELLASATRPFMERQAAQGYSLEIGAMPEAQMYADRLQIEVVLRNLLSNAVDAVAGLPGGERRICISAEPALGDQLGIRVEDNGPGLSHTQMDDAFEPFVSTKSRGLGLGLAISRAIAETHGGRLLSIPGDHGLFVLYLPIESLQSKKP